MCYYDKAKKCLKAVLAGVLAAMAAGLLLAVPAVPRAAGVGAAGVSLLLLLAGLLPLTAGRRAFPDWDDGMHQSVSREVGRALALIVLCAGAAVLSLSRLPAPAPRLALAALLLLMLPMDFFLIRGLAWLDDGTMEAQWSQLLVCWGATGLAAVLVLLSIPLPVLGTAAVLAALVGGGSLALAVLTGIVTRG